MGNVVGYSLWHRKADDIDYPVEPTCRLFKPNTKFLLSGLTPATQYFLKVVIVDSDREMGFHEFQFQTVTSQDELRNLSSKSSEVERSQSPATNCSSLSNPSSVDDEDENRGDNNFLPFNGDAGKTTANMLDDTINFSDQKSQKETPGDAVEDTSTEDGSNTPLQTGIECVPNVDSSEAGLPITPCKFENVKDDTGRSNRYKFNGKDTDIGSEGEKEPQAGSSSKKRSGERQEEECSGIGDKDFEYYVKVIRWLECDGHIETTFRQKFLTWYSLRATPQEVRVVKVFIDTFIEDPESLAGQLIDAFSDVISNKRCSTVPAGFCTKLWH
ncbi:UNVERIFIED_CONTAM: VIN3-like protein 2 [Sesamum angustifolium]|uniref:VIN3-like protein 2 n=1 Tax=Sesamum angustifolium TaxID=2727405 RepID=A0AAW2MWL4_9LAMI